MDELTREFLIESQEGLDRMERCLTELETRPRDAALLGDIFRSVHTIKGTTGFLGFKRLEKLAHAGENLLGLLRDGKLAADRSLITGLLQLLDGLRSILKSIETEATEGDGEDAELIAQLEELQNPASHPASPDISLKPPAPVPKPVRRRAAAKAVPLVTGISPQPDPPAAAAPNLAPAETSALPAPEPPESTATPAAQAANAGSAAESTLRVDVVLLNRMMNLVGELVLTRNQVLQATASDPRMTLLSRRLDMVAADLRESVMLSAVLKDIGLYSGATVLGNADLALILDPGAIAIKAGVAINPREDMTLVPGEEESDEAVKSMEYLLVEVAGQRAAVPLDDVLRIEQLPLSRIEYIGYRPVLNFEGQLMPVEDSGGVITAAQGNLAADYQAQIIVVVCRQGNRHLGIAVSHVLDVAAGGDLFEAGTRQRTSGVTLLKDRVTDIVGLGAVASLPVDANAPEDWNQIAETPA